MDQSITNVTSDTNVLSNPDDINISDKCCASHISKKTIKNLALCGGGFYGYAAVGALAELLKHSDRCQFENVCGVSVGSIIAALCCVGYDATEITDIMFGLNFDDLIKDTNLPLVQFYKKLGFYGANKLEDTIENLIRIKTNIKNCTFSQISTNLIIVATNLNYQCPVFFNKKDNPDMVISKAVRMSISYPGYITPVVYAGDLYSDGGEAVHYPITIFDNLEETIGIVFVAPHENDDGTLKTRVDINSVNDYIKSLGLTLSRSTYVSQINSKHLDRSIIVRIKENIESMQFNLSPEQKKYLYECGIASVQEQLHKIY